MARSILPFSSYSFTTRSTSLTPWTPYQKRVLPALVKLPSAPLKMPCPVVVFVPGSPEQLSVVPLDAVEYVIHDIIQDAIPRSEKLGHHGDFALRMSHNADDVERLVP